MSRRDRRPVSHTVTASPTAQPRPCDITCPECGADCAWVHWHRPDGKQWVPWDYAACTRSRCGWSQLRDVQRYAAEFGCDDPDDA